MAAAVQSSPNHVQNGTTPSSFKGMIESGVPEPEEGQQEQEPEIDIMISNVVCSFSVRCHLNLREIALNGINVEYRKENGKITMKLRSPRTTASIWSSGKVTCTGATSELLAKKAARRFARLLQKLGFKVRFNNYRVVNVLGTCSMPFAIKINLFSERHKEADYEPELHPGVTYRLQNPRATLKIFSTGSVTVTAPSVADVQAAIEYIYPLVYEFRKERTPEEIAQMALRKARRYHQDCDFEDFNAEVDPYDDTAAAESHDETNDENECDADVDGIYEVVDTMEMRGRRAVLVGRNEGLRNDDADDHEDNNDDDVEDDEINGRDQNGGSTFRCTKRRKHDFWGH